MFASIALSYRRALGAVATLTLLFGAIAPAATVNAATGSELFFSEYVEGSSNNKALEIYNPTDVAIDLAASGYAIEMYFNGSSSAGLTIGLTGTIQPADVFVVAHSSADAAILAVADQTNGSGWFNGDDAVVLTHNGTAIDVIGQVGNDPGSYWGTGDITTQNHTLRRKATITAGDTNATDAFDPSVEWDGYPQDTFDGLGSHTVGTVTNEPVSLSCPSSLTTVLGMATSASVTATDPDGTVTTLETTGITDDPGTITFDDVTTASAVGGTADGTLNVSDSTPLGSYSVTFSAANDDASPQTDTCTTTVSVQSLLTIGEVQGQVTDADIGDTQSSPFVGQTVFVRGVWTETSLMRTSSGYNSWSFFLQNTLATDDDNALTSDGITVYTGSYADFGYLNQSGYYEPVVGEEVVIRARVSEYYGLTELGSAKLVSVIRDGVDLSTEIAQVAVNPPHDLAASRRYWERLESMYVHVPANAQVVAGRDVFASTADGEMWVIRGDDPLMSRTDPYAQRVFRDTHPLDDINTPPDNFDNGNGERILLTSHGLKGAAEDNTVLIAPSHAFQTVTNELSGAVSYGYSKYGIEITQQPALTDGADPAQNAPPQPATADEFVTSDYNVQNLYDYRDDPTDGCDFLGNSGCPGVYPPFDYVPASEAAYQQHLADLAAQINGPMHDPDLLMIQEAEDQDVCSVVNDALDCGTLATATDINPDGKPDVLQELALTISAAGGPTYDAAFDRDGADDRGIVSAFLFRTDRVELLPAQPGDPVLGAVTGIAYPDPLAYNTDVSNPKAVNAVLPASVDTSTGVDGDNVYTRAPQVGHFRIWRTAIGESVFTDLWAISNHFSSGPDGRVGQRTEQAAYQAAIVAAIQAVDPGARIVSAGDFNVYPRPDDPFAPGEPYGASSTGPSDQLGPMYDAGLHNLWDDLVAEVPSSAYSYLYEGQAQTLDMQWATDAQYADLVQIRAAHINADWAADYDGDVGLGASDHDPQVARWSTGVTFDRLRSLVDYFVGTGDVSARKAFLLYDRLDRAEGYLAAGQYAAYLAQLQAFGNQAQGLAPKWVSGSAADVLQSEASHMAAG